MAFPNQPQKICRLINTPGGCYYGQKCKFSHDVSGSLKRSLRPTDFHSSFEFGTYSNWSLSRALTVTLPDSSKDGSSSGNQSRARPKPSGTSTSGHNAQHRDRFHEWKSMIPTTQGAPGLGTLLNKCFQTAKDLIERDSETMQAVISRLASEGGLLRINEIVQHMESANTARQRSNIFKELVPFFQILSNRDVLSSLILEKHVDTILTFLYGPSGRRGQAVFAFAVSQISQRVNEIETGNDESVEACCVVLARILDLQSSATLSTEFNEIYETLKATLDSVAAENGNMKTSRAWKYVERIGRRFGVREAIKNDAAAKDHSDSLFQSKPTFQLYQDTPGMLSEAGVRHDNDHENICNIRILPTASELRSQRQEFLPTTTYSAHAESRLEGLLDRQFRLLREDTVGQLREGVKLEYEDRQKGRRGSPRGIQAARTFTYQDAALQRISIHPSNGLELEYQFSQPPAVKRLGSANERKDWWLHSRRLQHGALVCLIDQKGTPVFCTVAVNGLIPEHPNAVKQRTKTPAISDDRERAHITLNMVDQSQESVAALLKAYGAEHMHPPEAMVEFPGVLLPAFRPTLEALQRMSRNFQEVPFAEIIAADNNGSGELISVQTPQYAQGFGYYFDLSCLSAENHELRLAPRNAFDMDALQRHTTLDNVQAESLKYALTHRVALIQGPPGTGKSFTGVAILKALTHNAKKSRIGPIICVTYTNHALDQLLEHLLKASVTQIIRIGSRSQSEMLEKLNLRQVVMQTRLTTTEYHLYKEAKQSLTNNTEALRQLFDAFDRAPTVTSIRDYLSRYNPQHCSQLFIDGDIDKEGFQVVGSSRKNPLQDWLLGGNTSSDSILRHIDAIRQRDIFTLTRLERSRLFNYWVKNIRQELWSRIDIVLEDYNSNKQSITEVRQEQELRCLRQAQVIGMTTSGLARIIGQLQYLNAKVLLMEEAGEVLEVG